MSLFDELKRRKVARVAVVYAATDRQLWSETFDRTLDDISAIQDEIAGAIGEALQVELLGTDGRTVSTAEISPTLYEKFLQSLLALERREALLTLLEWDDPLSNRLVPLAWSPEHAPLRRDPRLAVLGEDEA